MLKRYSPNIFRLLILAAGLWIIPTSGFSQCDPPAQLPSGMCNTAPLTCLQDACYTTLNNPPNGEPAMWCGQQTVINNPQYFLFQATSTSVQIVIHVDNCSGGQCGLQSGIIDACPWDVGDVLSCNPGTPAGGDMVLSYDMMQVDSFYYLLIDGCAGDICQYTINFVDGILEPDIPGELSNAFTNDPVVCQGWDNWTATAEPMLPEAHGYLWTGFPWGDGTHTSTLNDMSDNPLDIPDDAPPGDIYNLRDGL